MALLSEKLGSALIARETHARRFDEPGFHFVPRRKMMQVQAREAIGKFYDGRDGMDYTK